MYTVTQSKGLRSTKKVFKSHIGGYVYKNLLTELLNIQKLQIIPVMFVISVQCKFLFAAFEE